MLNSDQTGDCVTNFLYSIIVVDGENEFPLGVGEYNVQQSTFTGAGSVLNGSPGYVGINDFMVATNNIILYVDGAIARLPTYAGVSNIVTAAIAGFEPNNPYAVTFTNSNVYAVDTDQYLVGAFVLTNSVTTLTTVYTNIYDIVDAYFDYIEEPSEIAYLGSTPTLVWDELDEMTVLDGVIPVDILERQEAILSVTNTWVGSVLDWTMTTVQQIDHVVTNTVHYYYDLADISEDIDTAVAAIDIPPANYFNPVTEKTGTIINLSTNQIAYRVDITNDTTFILSDIDVAGALMLSLDFVMIYDIVWSNATLARNIEYATNTVYNFSCFSDGEEWSIIPISARAK
jgi:hypothetical protein